MDQLLDFKPLVTPLSALEPRGDMNPAKDDTEYIWTLEICSTLFSRPSRSGYKGCLWRRPSHASDTDDDDDDHDVDHDDDEFN